MEYGISKTISLSYEQAVEKVTSELKKEGFGILTSIDVKETLRNKLNVDFKKYVILGACNPPIAYQAFQADENIGLLLPCNVVVYEKGNQTVVAALDPTTMTSLTENETIGNIARTVKAKLERIIAAL